MAEIENWSRLEPAALWQAWREPFVSDTSAIAHAIWATNKLIKELPRKHHWQIHNEFYSIKDYFIESQQHHLVEGRIARIETGRCGICNGDGAEWEGGPSCGVCNGSGEAASSTLYQHDFVIDGQRYSFHSYYPPQQLSDEPGENLQRYGKPLTSEERQALRLPRKGLLKLLRHVAMDQWSFVSDNGVLYSPKGYVTHQQELKEISFQQAIETEYERQESGHVACQKSRTRLAFLEAKRVRLQQALKRQQPGSARRKKTEDDLRKAESRIAEIQHQLRSIEANQARRAAKKNGNEGH